MKKFDLSIYKNYKMYLNYFDILIKNETSNKENFLERILISPSSYRRAKKDNKKIGDQICSELCTYFKLKIFDNAIIEELEEKINRIYYNFYYKNYELYDEDYAWINNMIKENYVFNPIIQLMKLLLDLSRTNNTNTIVSDSKDLYNELNKYKLFYSEELLEILEIASVLYEEKIDISNMFIYYKNEIAYNMLASRFNYEEKYLESVFFCNLAKQRFLQKENFRRVYFINLILLANYNALAAYKESYDLAFNQLLSIRYDINYTYEFKATLKHYIIACVGMKKYNEVINELINKEEINTTDMLALLISLYRTSKSKYKSYLEKMKTNETNEKFINYYIAIDKYLEKGNKEALNILYNYDINKNLMKILKIKENQ